MTNYILGEGQTSRGITLNSGDTMLLQFGGIALLDTVDSGAVLTVNGGIAEADTINSGGSLVVSFSFADRCTIGGGSLIVAGGSTSSNTINKGGTEIVSRGMTLDEVINSGGSMTVLAGGTTEETVVTSGGSLTVASAGRLNVISTDKLVLLGGAVDVQSGSFVSGAIDFQWTSGGRLEIDGSTILSNTISGFVPADTIDLTGIAFSSAGTVSLLPGNVLQVVEGGGTYNLNLNPNQDFSDDTFQLVEDNRGGTLVTENTGPPQVPFFAQPQLAFGDFGPNAGGWSDQNLYPRLLGDMNGDGPRRHRRVRRCRRVHVHCEHQRHLSITRSHR